MPRRRHYAAEAAAIPQAARGCCAFAHCPEPGTITEAIVGPHPGEADHRTYFCRWHFATRHDPAAGRQVLEDLLAHPPPHPRDWRDVLLDEYRLRLKEERLFLASEVFP